MRIFAGMILVIFGFSMVAAAFQNVDAHVILMIKNKTNKDIVDIENYVNKNPIQDEFKNRDYLQEIANFKQSANTFNTTWVVNKPMISIVVRVLFGIVGLLYFISGFVLIMKLNWVTPMMGIVALSFFIFMSVFYFEMNSLVNLCYEMSKEFYNLSYILGVFKGNYLQEAMNLRDKMNGKLNISSIIISIIFLFIPIIYLVKAFLREEDKK